MSKYFNIKYFFLFVICIWEPVQVYIIKVDGAQRTIGILILLTILLNINKPNFLTGLLNFPIIFWGIWIVYAIINTIQIGYNWDGPYIGFIIILLTPLVVIWLINSENFNDRKILFSVIILGLFIRILMIWLFDVNRSYDEGRFGDKIDSNDIGISAIILIVFIYLKFLYKGYGYKLLLLQIAFPFFMIILSASRNALGAFSILLLSHLFIHRTKDKLTNFAFFIFFVGIIYMASSFLINNTYLGQRLTETTTQNSETEYEYDISGTIFDKMGDRGVFYVQGWNLFKEHPIRGIGLGNFKLYQENNLVLHTEYMVQLCELGLIGSLLFVLFYGWIGKNLFLCLLTDIENRKITQAYSAGFIIILFMGFTIFQYANPVFFLLSGAIIGYITNIKERSNMNQNE
jgi:hypothetical protein